MAVDYHRHNGNDSPRIFVDDIEVTETTFREFAKSAPLFKTVSSIPSGAPDSFIDQIQIYVSGGDIHLYVYDTTNTTWQRFNYYTP